jgi:ribose transport system permease protein
LRAVLFIDVDHLKTTNDTHGHEAGDHVLRTTAERLRRTVAPDDVVGRWGGDEFVVLVCRAATSADLDDLVSRLHAALAVPAAQGPIGASIGVVEVGRSDRRTADQLLRDADRAMYEAKRTRGRRSQ